MQQEMIAGFSILFGLMVGWLTFGTLKGPGRHIPWGTPIGLATLGGFAMGACTGAIMESEPVEFILNAGLAITITPALMGIIIKLSNRK